MNNIPKDLKDFFWLFISSYRYSFAAMGIISLVYAIGFSIRPYFLKIIVNSVVDDNLVGDYFGVLLWPVIFYIVLLLIISMSYRALDIVSLKVFPEVRKKMVAMLFEYTHSHSYEYFQNNFAGSIANKIANDITGGFESILQSFFSGILGNILAFCAGIVALSFSHIYFGIAAFFWSVIYSFGYIRLNRKSQIASRELAESKNRLAGIMVDSFSNVNNVKLFASKKNELDFIARYSDEVYKKDKEFRKIIFNRRFFSTLLNVVLSISMLLLLIYTNRLGLITVGDFAAVLTLSFLILDILRDFSREYIGFSRDLGLCAQAISVIAEPHGIKDNDKAERLVVDFGRIEFKNVDFSYANNIQLFKNLSVTIVAGEKVALVGYSGSGKTTFANLIVRLFDVQSGKILVDGNDIKYVTQDSLRQNITLVSQEPILFHRTLLENIRYGNPDADNNEVFAAAKKAHIHDFIINSPDAYNTMVGDKGIKLSVGQRQRIAIARAILKNSPILILDEAASSLDSVTEDLMQSSLDSYMSNKTTIMIAHRLSTTVSMDRILVFKNGHIVEDGSHHDLLNQKGEYWLLWNTQFTNLSK